MSLIISKQNRLYDFIHPQDESEHHISHLSKQNIALNKQKNDMNIIMKPYINKWKYANDENSLSDENQKKSSYKKEKYQLKKQMQIYKNLTPIKPLWESRCYNFNEWYDKYYHKVDEMYDTTLHFIYGLINGGYEIKLNENDLYFKLAHHLYVTSENIKLKFIDLR